MTSCDYRYTECGLDNVVLVGLPGCTDDSGEDVVTIPGVNQLHRLIAFELATKETGLTPRELRFLRTHVGKTQAELAKDVGKDAQTVGRWERGETPIESAAETLVRMAVLQRLEDEMGRLPPVEDIARRTVASSATPPLRVDASNPGRYRVLEAA